MVTIKDIAERAGVSYSTVSRSLNDYSGTNAETKKRICALAEEMGYETNAIARSLVTGKTNTIGFVLPAIDNPFFTDILSSATKVAEERGYNILICSTDWNSEKELLDLKMLSEMRADGVLLYPSDKVNDKKLHNLRVPYVVMGSNVPTETPQHPCVIVDNMMGARCAIDHLLACNYQRIAFLGGTETSQSSITRRKAFDQAVASGEIETRKSWKNEGDYTIASGYERARRILSQTTIPEAILCANDMIALGAMQAIVECGKQLATEIGVMGFDDIQYASLPQIQLSTVAIPRKELGRLSCEVLLDQINQSNKTGGAKLKLQSNIRVLSPRLIKRRTTIKRK